jgi:hypothetical protein
LLAADYTIRISVENRSSDYVYEVVDNVLVVLEAKSMVRLAMIFVLSEYSSSEVGQYSSGKLRVS